MHPLGGKHLGRCVLGSLVQRAFPNGQTLDFVYDDAKRLQSISGVLDAVNYNQTSRPESFQLANGVVESYLYNAEGRIAQLQATGPDDTVLVSRSLSFDGVGNLVEMQDNAPSSGLPSATVTYTYDALYRLLEAQLDEESLSYRYDEIGNLLSKISSEEDNSFAHVGALAYEGVQPHAVTQAGALDVRYNDAGAVIGEGGVSIQLDCFNRPKQLEQGQQLLRIVYGPGQQKVFQNNGADSTWTLGDHFEIRNGVAAVYVDFGGRRLAQITAGNMAPQLYTDVAPLDENFQTVPDNAINIADAWVSHAADRGILNIGSDFRNTSDALLNAALASLLAGEDTHTFHHADHQGNVVELTSSAGESLESRVYYPFGLLRASNGALTAAGFHNQDMDASFQLINYDARLLDPRLGRWLSPDPLFQELEDPNTHFPVEVTGAYAAMVNNPSTYRDQDGLSVVPTSGLFLLQSALNQGAYANVGLDAIANPNAYAHDKDSPRRLVTPGGRNTNRFGTALQSVGGSGRGIAGYLTGGVSALVSPGIIGEPAGIFFRHARNAGLTSQQQLLVRRAISTAPNQPVALSALGSSSGGAFPLSAISDNNTNGGLIAGGLSYFTGQSSFQRGVQSVSNSASRSVQVGDRALRRVGIATGFGLQSTFGSATGSLSSTFDQTQRHQESLQASDGNAAGSAVKRVQSANKP